MVKPKPNPKIAHKPKPRKSNSKRNGRDSSASQKKHPNHQSKKPKKNPVHPMRTPLGNKIWVAVASCVREVRNAVLAACLAVAVIILAPALYQAQRMANQFSDSELTSILLRPQLTIGFGETGEVNHLDCACAPILSTEELPAQFVAALLAVEDTRFYNHEGVDIRGILRATTVNLMSGSANQGASTITQQLVKNVVLSRERTLSRKFAEWLLATRVERLLDKDTILRTYLSRVNFGHINGQAVRGLRNASAVFFGKQPHELNSIEVAFLVGALRGPNWYHLQRHPDRASERASLVLRRMQEVGLIEQVPSLSEIRSHLPDAVQSPTFSRDRFIEDMAVAELRRLGLDQPNTLRRVVLTIDPRSQLEAQRIVLGELSALRGSGATRAALISIDTNGAVLSIVGGPEYQESSFNLATQAARQGASTQKLATYLAALEAGMTPNSTVFDDPSRIDGAAPRNADGRHLGAIPMWRCFAESRNVCTTWLAQRIGYVQVAEMAVRLDLVEPTTQGGAVVLGAANTTLLRTTAAYNAVLTDGLLYETHVISFAMAEDGNVLHRQTISRTHVIDPHHAELMQSLLRRAVIDGTGRQAAFVIPSFGKTGTSQRNRDAWFVGFTEPGFTTGVWIGPDDDSRMYSVSGGNAAAPIWRRFMATMLSGLTDAEHL